MPPFIEFGLIDLIDILLVGALFYQIYRLFRGRQAMNILLAVGAFLFVWVLVSYVFHMRLLQSILSHVGNVGVLALIILFQDEIRGFLASLGRYRSQNSFYNKLRHYFTADETSSADSAIAEITQAASVLSKSRTGALIVLQNKAQLTQYWRTGERIEARVKARLMENIFYKNTPLHDGALIIVDNRIKAVGCILPISHAQDLPKQFGLRHRAALGLSERTDATVIVVSEETGRISVAQDGKLQSHLSPEQLARLLGARGAKGREGKSSTNTTTV